MSAGEHPKGREAIRKMTEHTIKSNPGIDPRKAHKIVKAAADRHFRRERAEGRKG